MNISVRPKVSYSVTKGRERSRPKGPQRDVKFNGLNKKKVIMFPLHASEH